MEGETVLCTIRDLPKEAHALMKERARRNRRSLNQQLIVDIEEAANAEYAAQQSDSNRGKV